MLLRIIRKVYRTVRKFITASQINSIAESKASAAAASHLKRMWSRFVTYTRAKNSHIKKDRAQDETLQSSIGPRHAISGAGSAAAARRRLWVQQYLPKQTVLGKTSDGIRQSRGTHVGAFDENFPSCCRKVATEKFTSKALT